MDTRTCVAESLGCMPGTVTILLIGYTPIQNKKLKNIFQGSFTRPAPNFLHYFAIQMWIEPSRVD